jgi:PAS domain S-box-containing protein
VNADLVIIYLNERMANLTGYNRNEAVGQMTCGQLLNTPQCNTCDCVLKQVMEQEKPLSGLTRKIRNRSGQEIPVMISASIITDSRGKVIGGFEAIRDISPLVEAERKFNLLTELTREGIMMTDERQRILFVNQRMAQIVGLSREEIIGKRVKEVLSPQHHRSAKELAKMI